jgi:hypothetical protein
MQNKLCLACLRFFEKRSNTRKVHLASNFQCQKLEVESIFASLEHETWDLHERPNIFFFAWPLLEPSRIQIRSWAQLKFFCSTSNFRRWKLEVEQKKLLQAFLKTKVPKLTTFKGQKNSSNEFFQCNFWFLFNLLYFISLICKILSKQSIEVFLFFFSTFS